MYRFANMPGALRHQCGAGGGGRLVIPERVLDAFGMSSSVDVKPMRGTKNQNFRVMDENAGRTYVVRRRHSDYSGPEWVAFDHAAIRHLAQRGAPVLSPIAAVNGVHAGRTWVVEEGSVYEAYPFVTGRPFDERSLRDVEQVARGLAAVHRAGENFSGMFIKGRPRGEADPQRLFDSCDRLRADGGGVDAAVSYYERQIVAAAQCVPDERYGELARTLNHGDVHPGNVMMSPGGVTFVDYDWICRHPPIYDLAFALLFVCGDRAAPLQADDIWSLSQPFTLDVGKMAAFLTSYRAGLGAVADPGGGKGNGGRGSGRQGDGGWSAGPPDLLVAQMRLTWVHCRVDGARKVEPARRKEFLERDLETPFDALDALPADLFAAR